MFIFQLKKIIYYFKGYDNISPYPNYSGNLSKDLTNGEMNRISLNGILFDFSMDYGVISVKGILHIHDYPIEKKQYKVMPRFIK